MKSRRFIRKSKMRNRSELIRADLQQRQRALEDQQKILEQQRRELEREITQQAEKTALENKSKRAFLASMGHELRCAINSILLLTHSLIKINSDNLTAEQLETLQMIDRSAMEHLGLINEILDISRAEVDVPENMVIFSNKKLSNTQPPSANSSIQSTIQKNSFTQKIDECTADILIVYGDPRNGFVLTKLLKEHNYTTAFTHSAIKALEMLERIEVQLILVDIMMPDMDGYEFIRALRVQPRFQKTPIIVFTPKSMKGDYEKCIDAGANEYLSKPIDPERLFSLLSTWLDRE